VIIDTPKAIEFLKNELLNDLESKLKTAKSNDGIRDVKLIDENVIVSFEKPMITENQDVLGVLLKGGAIKVAPNPDNEEDPLKEDEYIYI